MGWLATAHYLLSECVILADSKSHKYLVENVRYQIDNANSVLIDRTQKMSRKDRRTTNTVTEFVSAVESLLNGVNQSVGDNRKIQPAIKHVFGQVTDQGKTVNRPVHLLRSSGKTAPPGAPVSAGTA